jgi:hypothetical protein
MKAFSFKDQLAIGEDGERLFIECYPRPLRKNHSRNSDLVCLVTGERIELKTDTYPVGETDNFFIERWSNLEEQKPGSLWQSRRKADVFIYYYSNDGLYWEFRNIKALIKRLEDLEKQGLLPVRTVPNKGWTTSGFLVKRRLIEDLAEGLKLEKK